jgi:hypothetical protein
MRPTDFWFWHFSDMARCLLDVCYEGKSGSRRRPDRLPVLTQAVSHSLDPDRTSTSSSIVLASPYDVVS